MKPLRVLFDRLRRDPSPMELVNVAAATNPRTAIDFATRLLAYHDIFVEAWLIPTR